MVSTLTLSCVPPFGAANLLCACHPAARQFPTPPACISRIHHTGTALRFYGSEAAVRGS